MRKQASASRYDAKRTRESTKLTANKSSSSAGDSPQKFFSRNLRNPWL
jgi:hypothetical protein